MNAEHIFGLLKNASPILVSVAEQADAIFRNASNLTIYAGETLRTKTYWLDLYRQRKMHCDAIGAVVYGLGETIEGFLAASGNLRAIAITADDQVIYCWEDETNRLAGCVIG